MEREAAVATDQGVALGRPVLIIQVMAAEEREPWQVRPEERVAVEGS